MEESSPDVESRIVVNGGLTLVARHASPWDNKVSMRSNTSLLVVSICVMRLRRPGVTLPGAKMAAPGRCGQSHTLSMGSVPRADPAGGGLPHVETHLQ